MKQELPDTQSNVLWLNYDDSAEKAGSSQFNPFEAD